VVIINRFVNNHYNPIVLLDVDETASLSKAGLGYMKERGNEYNTHLYEAFLRAGIRDIMLFTAYSLQGVLTVVDENDPTQNRYSLLQKLNEYGFILRGVMTLDDPLYNVRPGQYYLDKICHWEMRALEHQWKFADLKANEEFRAELVLETDLQFGTKASKGDMYKYLISHLSPLDTRRGFIFVDDKPVYIKDVLSVHNHLFVSFDAEDKDNVAIRGSNFSDMEYRRSLAVTSGMPHLQTIQCYPEKFWEGEKAIEYYFDKIISGGRCYAPIGISARNQSQSELLINYSIARGQISTLGSFFFPSFSDFVDLSWTKNACVDAMLSIAKRCSGRCAIALVRLAVIYSSDVNDHRESSEEMWKEIVSTKPEDQFAKLSRLSHEIESALQRDLEVFTNSTQTNLTTYKDAILAFRFARCYSIQYTHGATSILVQQGKNKCRRYLELAETFATSTPYVDGYFALLGDINILKKSFME
jgi:hypothetical protein